MALIKCIECGQVFDKNLDACPNCGCPASECEAVIDNVMTNALPQTTPPKKDWANTIYECGALFWDTFTKRYAQFSGRATRSEYFSFIIVLTIVGAMSWGWIAILFIIPGIAVFVRRLHDINRSGWWGLLPWVSFFMQFKKSDEGANQYGLPSDIKL